jgi:Fic family protein
MLITDFTKDKSGQLLKTAQGYWAFIPNPLPPKLPVSWELTKLVSEADRALSELVGVTKTLPNPHLLINPFLRREAVLSSRIEGTQASLSDLFYFEASNRTELKGSDVKEVANYVKALEYGLARLENLPISLRLIRELHLELMRGVCGEAQTPGEFRWSQNWIGPPGCTLNEAVFVPPPVPEMTEALTEFEKYLHADSPLPSFIRLALVHYQFEAIHPFLDGNGRIGRLLLSLLLCVEKITPQPLLYLSDYFERNRQQYYNLLLGVSQAGKWIDWISFFLKGVAVQSKDALRRSSQLLELRKEYRTRLQSARSSALLLRLIDQLFSIPAITLNQTMRILDVSAPAAQHTLNKLIAEKILHEITGQQRNRIYAAQDIIKIIEAKEIDNGETK